MDNQQRLKKRTSSTVLPMTSVALSTGIPTSCPISFWPWSCIHPAVQARCQRFLHSLPSPSMPWLGRSSSTHAGADLTKSPPSPQGEGGLPGPPTPTPQGCAAAPRAFLLLVPSVTRAIVSPKRLFLLPNLHLVNTSFNGQAALVRSHQIPLAHGNAF